MVFLEKPGLRIGVSFILIANKYSKENYKGIEGMGDISTYDVLRGLKTEHEMVQVCTQLFVNKYGLLGKW